MPYTATGTIHLETIENPRYSAAVEQGAHEAASRIAQFITQPVCSCASYPEPQVVTSRRVFVTSDDYDLVYDCARCGATKTLEK